MQMVIKDIPVTDHKKRGVSVMKKMYKVTLHVQENVEAESEQDAINFIVDSLEKGYNYHFEVEMEECTCRSQDLNSDCDYCMNRIGGRIVC